LFKAPGDFIKGFTFSEEYWNQFVQAAAKDSVNITGTNEKVKADLINRIRSSIARQLWRNEGYFETMNASDDAVLRSLEILAR
jgi:carboxyl-terminal processing protease